VAAEEEEAVDTEAEEEAGTLVEATVEEEVIFSTCTVSNYVTGN
jgi:hypothetical protein